MMYLLEGLFFVSFHEGHLSAQACVLAFLQPEA
jgi:hypothetical protein